MQSEIERLARNINEGPDKLHGDYTPAVHGLIEIGEPALPAALDLMLSDDRDTRQRAQRVVEGVTMRAHGFRAGRGWDTGRGEDEWRRFWQSLGDLDYDSPPEARARAVDQWRRWLAQSSDG